MIVNGYDKGCVVIIGLYQTSFYPTSRIYRQFGKPQRAINVNYTFPVRDVRQVHISRISSIWSQRNCWAMPCNMRLDYVSPDNDYFIRLIMDITKEERASTSSLIPLT
ncbi:hypothetical protein CFOL_v3_05552 [Cephalotus follicularis]|uniref:Uncharacterized protein n=1 Tax=Cephalotus follicularis TaxID=3775 RepID=A0A1Q3B247_CEPFO|nr:hypothetical protein CFOL_v3_05552 [Cephalotus follicularis]